MNSPTSHPNDFQSRTLRRTLFGCHCHGNYGYVCFLTFCDRNKIMDQVKYNIRLSYKGQEALLSACMYSLSPCLFSMLTQNTKQGSKHKRPKACLNVSQPEIYESHRKQIVQPKFFVVLLKELNC